MPLTAIQQLIGRRMLKSKAEKPCFYLQSKADITEMMSLRPSLRKRLKVKITTNAFYIRAVAKASRKFPRILAKLDTDLITIPVSINVGFAVNAPQGLVVPVVKNADQKSLAQIACDEKILTDKARSNQLTLEEITGETIALSNLGVYGIDSFVGIIPPPASTILAVGNIISTVVPIDNSFLTRKMLNMSLAVDHTVVNGDYAAQFLDCIKDQLQNPSLML